MLTPPSQTSLQPLLRYPLLLHHLHRSVLLYFLLLLTTKITCHANQQKKTNLIAGNVRYVDEKTNMVVYVGLKNLEGLLKYLSKIREYEKDINNFDNDDRISSLGFNPYINHRALGNALVRRARFRHPT